MSRRIALYLSLSLMAFGCEANPPTPIQVEADLNDLIADSGKDAAIQHLKDLGAAPLVSEGGNDVLVAATEWCYHLPAEGDGECMDCCVTVDAGLCHSCAPDGT